MKSILVIGIGRFGQHLCENLAKHDNQIMAVDISEEKLEPVLSYVVSAKIGDCTNEAVLRAWESAISISASYVLEIISRTVWRLPV